MKLFSPAKINLGLRIPYKRKEDNYHQIESLFVLLDWGDHLEINFSESDDCHLTTKIELHPSKISKIESVLETGDLRKNLIYKTWSLAREINPNIPGINVHLTKRIPPGGGLGGGSSNSASVWKFLVKNNYVSLDLAKSESLKLGADIPFFLYEKNAWVTGIGEKIETVSISNGFGVIAVPEISLPTAEMYAKLKKPLQFTHLSKTWNSQEGKILSALEEGNWKSLQGNLTNDFESVAYEFHPDLQEIRDAFLENGAEYSSLTGSGSSIYGLVSTPIQQNQLLNQMKTIFPKMEFHIFSF
ncbi:4-(cytidine 5'-diphospho)-2-C-methyl-D-erythritol kinase [Leptospira sp. GIMC2001]|uniref:4-(cytidine 5'-diphospho)-2-C-methyl-D-erythritol kinase n=1 Tax=Leptospira sp. GIMC2001 TaxID=1513297 RepID=UPI00234A631D|nr:4-(cytidine 5'-diphospho)-2-C-methyl-D-erythritol kinase [Leptospira sp. GIMC2001]WCL49964.1 4-(cytidine 5'-diphospho)-2-C-methyl-D-erythritol kinase [Leptospira sp. GIMC2001]